MIWATVSSRSCFFWLYRASPSLGARNIINLISVLTIWWSTESSLVLLEEGVCYDQWILLAELYWPLPCFIPYSKVKCACYSRCFLTSYFCIPVPYHEKWREVKSLSHVQLCGPMDCSLPGSSVHGIFQARVLEWVAISFPGGPSQLRDQSRSPAL